MEVFIADNRVIVDENKIISSGHTRTGDVYILNSDEVIKLYRHILPYYNDYHKTKFDTLRKIIVDKFVMPLEIVYDEEGNVIGYTMRYIKGNNGEAILEFSSKFLIEELEKVYDEVSILSQNNISIYDLVADNIIVNEEGMHFIDTDDYTFKRTIDYDKNMADSNFWINIFLKNAFAKIYSYKKNDYIDKLFDNYDIFYKEALRYYKPNQTVKSLVKRMVRNI